MDKLTAEFITYMITTVCTMRCKHCTLAVPQHEPKHCGKELLIEQVYKTFEVFDYISVFKIMGGEAFLHPNIDDLLLELSLFAKQFSKMIILTNGTVAPRQSTIDTLCSIPYEYFIRIDDYGYHSKKLEHVIELFDNKGIPYELRPFNDDTSYGGGWVDIIGNHKHHDYSVCDLLQIFDKCLNKVNCKFIWDGRLWACGMQASGELLGRIPSSENDSLDLFSSITIVDKRDAVRKWGNSPYMGCSYCNGFDIVNSPRIPAAEQI